MNDRSHALETHAGIDVPLRQGRKRSVRVGVELNENQIPDLDAARIARVDKRSAGVAVWRQIDMQLRARTARTGIAHHPEIVCLVSVNDVNLWIKVGLAKQSLPVVMSFLIELARLAGSRFVNGGVDSLRGKFPALHHQFPSPFDRFLLK